MAGGQAVTAGTGAAAGSGAGAGAGEAGRAGGASGTGAAGRAPAAGSGGSEDQDAGAEPSGAAGAASGVAGAGAAGAAAAGSGGAPPSSGFPAVTDLQAKGPFTATTIAATGPNGNYTVHLPMQLAPNGSKNPIVGWMSGGGTDPSWYTLLPHLASHGFVVVASNTVPSIGAEAELGQEIIAGIDWALAENGKQGSMLFEKLDGTKIASMGYSMGSLATFMIANDERLTTTVHISGGNMVAERVNNLHAPAAFLCGSPNATCNILATDCDIAAVNCDTDFAGASTPVFYGNFPGGHLGIMTSPHMERISGAVTGWLRWQLMGDASLKGMFVGPQCTMCSDANWKVQQKNLQ